MLRHHVCWRLLSGSVQTVVGQRIGLDLSQVFSVAGSQSARSMHFHNVVVMIINLYYLCCSIPFVRMSPRLILHPTHISHTELGEGSSSSTKYIDLFPEPGAKGLLSLSPDVPPYRANEVVLEHL